MNKSVLASIKPKYCELIAARKKTLEIRKNRPKIDVPFKVYIYCTAGKEEFWVFNGQSKREEFGNGKVIGEFVCDDISKFTAEFTDGNTYEDIRYCYLDECNEEQEMIVVSSEWNNPNNCWLCKESCLSFDDFRKYIGENFHDKPFYAWHISELGRIGEQCSNSGTTSLVIYDKPKELSEFGLTRPPQSWCYVSDGEHAVENKKTAP